MPPLLIRRRHARLVRRPVADPFPGPGGAWQENQDRLSRQHDVSDHHVGWVVNVFLEPRQCGLCVPGGLHDVAVLGEHLGQVATKIRFVLNDQQSRSINARLILKHCSSSGINRSDIYWRSVVAGESYHKLAAPPWLAYYLD